MNETEVLKILTPDENERLRRLLENAPMIEIASALGEYRKALRDAGFKKWQAWSLTFQLHGYLCAAIFNDKS